MRRSIFAVAALSLWLVGGAWGQGGPLVPNGGGNFQGIIDAINGPIQAGTNNIGTVGVAQGSTTSGQYGNLGQCAVTTQNPSYTTTQTNPVSCDPQGNQRVVHPDAGNTTAGTGNATCSATCNTTNGGVMIGPLDTTSYAGIAISVTAWGNATGQFQVSDDNTTWINVAMQNDNVNTGSLIAGSTGGTGSWHGFTSHRYWRFNVSAYSSGTLTVYYTLRSSAAFNQIVTQTAIIPSATAANGITPVVSSAAEASHVLKASAGQLYSAYAVNTTATVGYCLIINATSAPTTGSAVTPLDFAVLPANGQCSFNYRPGPTVTYGTGITFLVSSNSSPFTFTSGVITAAIHGDVQ